MDDGDAAAKAKGYRERAEALRATVLGISPPDNNRSIILLHGADAFDQLADALEQEAAHRAAEAAHPHG